MGEPLLACLHRRIRLVHERGIQMPEAMKPAPRGTVMPSNLCVGSLSFKQKGPPILQVGRPFFLNWS
jgi:hypothetical protein